MARKKKKITKAQKRKIALKNLKKAWKANRGRKRKRSKKRKSRRKNPRKRRTRRKSRSKKRTRRKSRSKKRTRRRSRAKSRRRNPRLGPMLRAQHCGPKSSRRLNPGCDCLRCPEHAHLIRSRNPGWAFRGGQAISHDRDLEAMYPNRRMRSSWRHKRPRRRFNPGPVLRASMCDSPW